MSPVGVPTFGFGAPGSKLSQATSYAPLIAQLWGIINQLTSLVKVPQFPPLPQQQSTQQVAVTQRPPAIGWTPVYQLHALPSADIVYSDIRIPTARGVWGRRVYKDRRGRIVRDEFLLDPITGAVLTYNQVEEQ